MSTLEVTLPPLASVTDLTEFRLRRRLRALGAGRAPRRFLWSDGTERARVVEFPGPAAHGAASQDSLRR